MPQQRKMARRVEVVVTVVLLVISTAHLVRLLSGAEIRVAGVNIPVWTSLLGWLGPLLLAGLFWYSHRPGEGRREGGGR